MRGAPQVHGATPLHIAVGINQEAVARVLVQAGADKDTQLEVRLLRVGRTIGVCVRACVFIGCRLSAADVGC